MTSSTRLSSFQLLAVLPQEQAPQISRELRRALSELEATSRSSSSFSGRNVAFGRFDGVSTATNIPLFVSPVPVSNDSERILAALCDALEIHNPSVALSLLDPHRNFYVEILANYVGLPLISLSQNYGTQMPLLFQVRLFLNYSLLHALHIRLTRLNL